MKTIEEVQETVELILAAYSAEELVKHNIFLLKVADEEALFRGIAAWYLDPYRAGKVREDTVGEFLSYRWEYIADCLTRLRERQKAQHALVTSSSIHKFIPY